eukprot:363283-Chlamydomonas_euryale.AAC.4
MELTAGGQLGATADGLVSAQLQTASHAGAALQPAAAADCGPAHRGGDVGTGRDTESGAQRARCRGCRGGGDSGRGGR